MPIYEYLCNECQHIQERFQWLLTIEDAPLCCDKHTHKIPSVATAHFYGPGAYETEYGTQWRNKWGRGFKKHHEGKEPRKLTEKFKQTEEYKEWS